MEEHVASLVTVQAVLPIDVVVITVGRSLPFAEDDDRDQVCSVDSSRRQKPLTVQPDN